ncbi:hypothetical protein RUV71_002728 [Vibrio cholerae]|uniref:hypothetical protein n=1 Tax=Vibrio cholerae TaxID=666 RepID=UPI00157AE507|nr:hypothetical protein [Vibrio cholerae]EKF9475610.1 hypothetical protein [Vibrio cholerae]ELK1817576.1 hypothetical protein [Vibrio cholerae]GIB17728.1 hypothetical protein VCSRO185_1557 [Vibrio cholerae]CAB1255145.1 Uncharacterised protein [Vibrio cholerae]
MLIRINIKHYFFKIFTCIFLLMLSFLNVTEAAWLDKDKQMMGVSQEDASKLSFYGRYWIGDRPPSYPGDIFVWYSDDKFTCSWRGTTNVKMTYSQLNSENFRSLRNAISELLASGVKCSSLNTATEKETFIIRYVSSYRNGSMHESITMKARINHSNPPNPIKCDASITTMDFGRINKNSINLPSEALLNIQCSDIASITLKINGGKDFNDKLTGATINFKPVSAFSCKECDIALSGSMLTIPNPGKYSWAVPINIQYD